METLSYLVTNVLLPLLVGGIGAFIYPRMASYWKNRSLSARQRKLENIFLEYKRIKTYSTDSSRLIIDLIYYLASLLGALAMLIILVAVWSSENILALMAYGFMGVGCISLVNRIHSMINDSENFQKYREKTLVRYKKLGGDPTDLT